MAKHRDFFKQFFGKKTMISREKSSIAKEKEVENSASFSDINAWYSDYPLTSKPYKKDFFGFSEDGVERLQKVSITAEES